MALTQNFRREPENDEENLKMTICRMNLLFQGAFISLGYNRSFPRLSNFFMVAFTACGASKKSHWIPLVLPAIYSLTVLTILTVFSHKKKDSTKCLLEGDRSVLYAFQNSFLHLGKTLLDHRRHSIELFPTQAWRS